MRKRYKVRNSYPIRMKLNSTQLIDNHGCVNQVNFSLTFNILLFLKVRMLNSGDKRD